MRSREGARRNDQPHRRQPSGLRDHGSNLAGADFAGAQVMSLDGKIALVTGASRGIGQAIAQALGKQGAIVVGTSTTAGGAEGIGQQLAGAGIKGAGMPLNVGDSAQCEAVVADIQKRFGEISILVNNAGVTRDNLLVRMKDEEWDAVIDTD